MTPRIADASEIPVWGWMGWTLLALVAISVLVFLAVKRDPTPDVHDEPTGCHQNRHQMLPTAYGWRCANDCGESWYVDEKDSLAEADLALWSIENGWVSS